LTPGFRDDFYSGAFAGTKSFSRKPSSGRADSEWKGFRKSEKRVRNGDKLHRKTKNKAYLMDNVAAFNKLH
jgi:hypothetical protein